MFIELNEVQKSIYFECLAGGKLAYNISAALRVQKLDVSVLKKALMLLVSEQEALRSSIAVRGNQPMLEIRDEAPVAFAALSAENESDLEKKVKEAMFHAFDLETPPLYHTAYIASAEQAVFVVSMHHLISDGISADLFIRRLFALYHSMTAEEPFSLSVNDGYQQFLQKENRKLTAGKYERQRTYWKQKMDGAEPLSLIPDRIDNEAENGIGAEQRFAISPALYEKLDAVAKAHDMSVFMVVLGAFSVLMGRYANTDDVVISSSFSYRPGFSQDESIGCYIYTLPLRFDTQANQRFSDVMQQSLQNVFEAYQNIGYPNNLIARDVMPADQMINGSLFDITFICDMYDKQADEIEGIYETDEVTFPGKMMVIMQTIGDESCMKFQYKRQFFSDDTIRSMGEHFVQLLEQAASDPEQTLLDLNWFTTGEEQALLTTWNASDYFPYIPQNIADVFEKKVQAHPDAIALTADGKTYTNAEINAMANSIAARLIPLKKAENPLIGVQLRRSPALIASLLGVLKAGCGYVPIDVHYPEERKAFIMKDASVSVVITAHEMMSEAFANADIIFADDDALYQENAADPQISRHPEDLAYVEYTSGSTGTPKGVMITNANVINTALDLERRFPLEEQDVYLLKTTYTFDIFGTEFYGWIVGNGRLCLLEQDGEMKPEVIAQTVFENRVTHINFVPSMFRLFLEAAEHDAEMKSKLQSLKWVFLGGEAVTQDVMQKYFALGISAKAENMYGPTEATMWATHQPLRDASAHFDPYIGAPLNAYRCYIADRAGRLCPVGVPGELCISGAGLAKGYLNRPELNADRFTANPFYRPETDAEIYQKMYRTGDLARRRPDGNLEFLGRMDAQVKIGGVRIELGEIETAMGKHSKIVQAVAAVRKDRGGMDCICAYYTGAEELPAAELRKFLADLIPGYMIPMFFIYCEKIPQNNSGKADRKALAAMALPSGNGTKSASRSDAAAETIAQAWQDVLGTDAFDENDSFFEIGGHSFALIRVHNILKEKLDPTLSINALIQYPTVRKLADYLAGSKQQVQQVKPAAEPEHTAFKDTDIAIVGISVDVPGASDVQAFWNVLKNGEETIHFYSDAELRELGIGENLIHSKHYVKAKGRVDDLEVFDSFFFGISPKETELTSPSLRLLYKGAWQVLEDAGYVPETFDGRIGVFLGGSDDFAWYRHALFHNQNYSDTYQAYTLSTNHFLATRLSYKYDFKGPALTALTGCSTSLVTAHLACRSLQAHECEMAIAGGITVELPNEGGYLYEAGMMFSPDGHCRPFDAQAAGTVFSNGMALVAMRRLEDAVRDGDHIYAVIKGSALNNDGSNKISYTAPSEDGQVEVIRAAYQNAGIDPTTVRYVEAHGTGTLLGDPIEVSSLTRAFATDQKQFCTLGSLKGNIGHTDTAAGVVGLSKVSLCLDRKYLPATVNYAIPNPKANFEQTPFVVKNTGEAWERSAAHPEIPLRAGINSFGVGGTNAHFVLEEAPQRAETPSDSRYHILPFAAKTETALHNTMAKVLRYLAEHPEIRLADAAYTLRNGRKKFAYRKYAALTEDMRTPEQIEQLIERLTKAQTNALQTETKQICFLFSGQGSQYQGMCKALYTGDSADPLCSMFREEADRILNCLPEQERAEYFDVLYGTADPAKINQTQYTQFALFLTEYAIAQILLRLGAEPAQLLGHSIGEVTAAAVAGIWTPEDAVRIVIARGKLMQAQKPGSMLAVMADASEIEPYLPETLSLCLRNTTARCVVGGCKEDVEAFSAVLKEKGIGNTILRTSHAFHTGMMQEAAEQFRKVLAEVTFHAPKYRLLSNVTGTYAGEEMQQPQYWAEHIMSCVLFEQNLHEMFTEPAGIAVEIGPGKTLTAFARQHADRKDDWAYVNTVRHIKETASDIGYLYEAIGMLESAGLLKETPEALGIKGNRVSLPTYVFDPISYPIRLTEEPETTGKQMTAARKEKKQIVALTDLKTAEHYAAYAYREVFGFEELDMDADFFALGGDSLKAVSMAAALKNVLGIVVEVNDIFANVTPRKLAEYLLANHKTEAADADAIEPAPEQDAYTISAAQRRMYTMYQMDREALAYNLPSATAITGRLEPERVTNAVRKLMQRHELLRSTFEMRGNQIVQVIHDVPETLPVAFSKQELDSEEAFQQAAAKFVKPFCLETGPLFRMELVDTGEDRQLLFFDIHHIIADGTAVEILTRDFNTLYAEDMEPLRIQYKDYAYWQHENANSERLMQQEAYWLGQLQGELPVLELPSDHPRKEISGVSGGRVKFDLTPEAEAAVQTLGRQYGATNFMVMLTAWYILLARYSGQDDIIVGTPVSGRTTDDTREMIGMFVNMLALRNYPSGEKYVSDFLQEVKENVLQALQNQDYQFDTLTERIHVERKLNRNAVFDVSFDYHNMRLYDLEVNGLKFKSREIDSHAVSTDLILTCFEDETRNLTGCIDYAADLFEPETIGRMTAQYQQILCYAAENPDCRLSEIPLFSAPDLEIIKRQFAKNTTDEPCCIQELFAQTAARIPDAIALMTSDGKQYTYAELDAETNRAARALRADGVKPESCVGIMAERNEDLVIAVLAILKAGGTYVPLDVRYPQERLQYMAEQCRMHCILASDEFAADAEKMCRVLKMRDVRNTDDDRALTLQNDPDDTAYIIFTSGSTGQPKGVLVRHANVVNLIRDHQARGLFAAPDDRIASIASPSFDIFVFETLIPLCSGGSVYMASAEEQLDSVLLSQKILAHHVNYLQAPVSRLRAMTDNTEFRAVLPQMRVIVGGGEMYPVSLMEDLRQKTPARLFNMYGPTETTVTATVKELTEADEVNIGSAIANTQLLVLNDTDMLQPVGVYGELCIAGAGISKGYLNRQEETEKRFISVLLPDGTSIPVYRTGDRARLLANGEAELSGRMDDQVKIRGYRIELGEIEKAAVSQEGIAYAAAKAFTAENGNTQLALFYSISEQNAAPDSLRDALSDTLKKKLPPYMIPTVLVPVSDMPVLRNGKVDRKALSLPHDTENGKKVTKTAGNAAKTKIEAEILKIWKNVLNSGNISIKDNFFDIGGNSYSLMLVNNQLNDLLGRTIPLMTLFEHPTVSALAAAVGAEDDAWQEAAEEAAVDSDSDIAVIGMFGRFPGADSPEQFWENIVNGTESIGAFTEAELQQAGIRPEEYHDPDYVNAKGSLADVDYFDADFFKYSKKEANAMDPQMRVLHMCVWNALEDAGYDPYRYQGKIGLFAGSSSNMAWMTKFLAQRDHALQAFEVMTINDKDFLTTKISYKLNLKGPSMNVQTACSTSLVAIHQAVKYLQCGEADIAAAGGVSITYPRKEGYLWHEGMIYSRDGHCRPFSDDASGTVPGNGCAVVVLKKLSAARRDHDNIYAVIKGSAINNDGIDKIGYTAPSITGEMDVIRKALRQSGIQPEEIQYAETHGTGTALGDPIEISALDRAWNTDQRQYCALGAVKANIGHLDAAAGAAGFIKAVQVLQHKTIPPLVHFHQINPKIDLANSPFYITTTPKPITAKTAHASVSAFGIGGTNAHVILEESPQNGRHALPDMTNLLVFSAKTESALSNTVNKVCAYLHQHPEVNLSDAAYTLQVGRGEFEYRKACIFRDGVQTETITGNCNEQTPAQIWNIPDERTVLQSDLYGRNDGIGQLFTGFADEILRVLRYSESHAVKEALRSGQADDKTIQALCRLTACYAAMKTMSALCGDPERICAEGIAHLSAAVYAGLVQPADAVQQITNATEYAADTEEMQHAGLYIQNCLYAKDDAPVLTLEGFGADAVYRLIAEIWVSGGSVRWTKLHGNTERYRVSVPGYQFDRVRFDSDVSWNDQFFAAQTDDAEPIRAEGSIDYAAVFADIWKEILGSKPEQDTDDFFAQGGESFHAVTMASLIHKRMHVDIPVSEILDAAQFGQILQNILNRVDTSCENTADTEIPILPDQEYYETSSAQKRMYTVQQMLGDSIAYNLAAVYRVDGEPDIEKLRNVFDTLVMRHASFRTSFAIVDDEIVQQIHAQVPSVLTCETCAPDQLDDAVKRAVQPFDLSQAPLMRVKVISTGADEHYLVVDMHHIIADQSSMAVMMQEFSLLYAGKTLPENQLRYVDFAAWQNRLMQSSSYEKQMRYWLDEFSDEIPTLDFHTDYRKTEQASMAGKIRSFVLDPALCTEINQWLEQKHMTGYVLIAAALEMLLWKYTDKTDFVFGTAFSGRRSSELNAIIGMFVNTLPIRVKMQPEQSADVFLQEVRRKLFAALEAQDCQYDQLVEALGVNENGGNPLFDFVLNYVSVGTEDFEIDGLQVTPCVPDEISAKYDFTITVVENGGQYQVDIEYRTALFRDETAELFGERLIQTVQQLIRKDGMRLSEYSLMTDADWTQYALVNQTDAEIPADRSTAELFVSCAKKYGDRIALIRNDETYTYSELDRMSDYVAKQLQDAGAAVGDRIGLVVEESILQIAAILGVLKCGAAYIPIDAAYPDDRIAYTLRDSGAKLAVTTAAHAGKMPDDVPTVILSEQETKRAMTQDIAFALPDGLHGDLEAYIIYTSGSTGNPKGVVISCRSMIRTVINAEYYDVKPDDRIMQMSSYTFDASVFNIFGALLNGAALVMVPRETLLEISEFAKLIEEKRVTKALIITAVFNVLVDYDVHCMRYMDKIYVGGEALSYSHIAKAFSVLGAGHLVNLYGPTEAAMISTSCPIDALDPVTQQLPIGKPIANTSIYILDSSGNILPKHMIGELCIGGIGLAREYLSRPELTAEKFIYLREKPTERVYRSGDLAMMLDDGNIAYIGRMDEQVKLRGFRIELGEIERKLGSVPGVREAAVLFLKDSSGSPYLSGYYTTQSNMTLTDEQIRTELRKSLPDYMIPSKLTYLAEMPVTGNGKTDRKKLPQMKPVQQAAQPVQTIAAGNDTAALILKQMQEVLERPDLRANDDFYANGGHSLKAIMLVQRLKNAGLNVMVHDIIHHPTAASLAAACGVPVQTESVQNGCKQLTESQTASLVRRMMHETEWLSEAIVGGKVLTEFPMTAVQKAHRNSGAVQSGFTVTLRNGQDAAALRKIAAELMICNQMLHCTADPQRECWLEWDAAEQRPVLEQSIPYLDLSDYDAASCDNLIQALFERMMYDPYRNDLPAWRIACVQRNQQEIQVIWTFHHSVFDGMSAEILKRALQTGIITQPEHAYSDFALQIARGPVQTTAYELTEQLRLADWTAQNEKFLAAVHADQGETQDIVITVPMEQTRDGVWNDAYCLTGQVLSAYYGLDQIPTAVLHYGRKYCGQDYYDCVGEFLDLVPVISSVSEQELEQKLQYVQEHNVSLMHLLYDSPDPVYGESGKRIRKLIRSDGKLDLMLFNFQGEISAEEQKLFGAEHPAAKETEDTVSVLSAAVCYDDTQMRISLSALNGFRLDRMKQVVGQVSRNAVCKAESEQMQRA